MSKPDTNQASEDELRQIFIDSMWSYFGVSDEGELAHFGAIYDKVVKAIIRTEKLKLLAEVRERVVGEDDETIKTPLVTKRLQIIDRNMLRLEQRGQLTKLETECMNPTNEQELDINRIEKIIADHNKDMRTDMASEIVGGTRSKAITDVITVKAIAAYITANYTANSEVAERERAARIDEIRRTRPHLTYPGMVYYGERMNELRGAETEEVK